MSGVEGDFGGVRAAFVTITQTVSAAGSTEREKKRENPSETKACNLNLDQLFQFLSGCYYICDCPIE